MPDAENGARIWPPADWCSAVNPERTHICDQPRGHNGDHRGPELPTVEIDEWDDEGEDEDNCQHEWELRSEHDTWVCAYCQAEDHVLPPAKRDDWHEFDEDVNDASMCMCGVPALYHDSVFPPGSSA